MNELDILSKRYKRLYQAGSALALGATYLLIRAVGSDAPFWTMALHLLLPALAATVAALCLYRAQSLHQQRLDRAWRLLNKRSAKRLERERMQPGFTAFPILIRAITSALTMGTAIFWAIIALLSLKAPGGGFATSQATGGLFLVLLAMHLSVEYRSGDRDLRRLIAVR